MLVNQKRALRDVFNKARAVSPSIIFFDEIDTLAGKDGAHGGVQIESTFLNELDGITELKDVFVLAATNRPENMSPALTRSGRLNPMLLHWDTRSEGQTAYLRERVRKR